MNEIMNWVVLQTGVCDTVPVMKANVYVNVESKLLMSYLKAYKPDFCHYL